MFVSFNRFTISCFFLPLLLFVSVPVKAASEETERLAYLGKVWGYLKYHHPKVGKGDLDWDAALLQAISKVKAAKTKKDYNLILTNLLNQAGPLPEQSPYTDKPAQLKVNIDEAWFQNDVIVDKLVTEQLAAVQKAFIPQPNFYVSNGYQAQQQGQPVFMNEKSYEDLTLPDEKYRLLALIRYWNAVNYFYPHKHLLGNTWHENLIRFIPKMQQAQDALTYQLAFAELAATLNDAQAGAFSPLLRDHFGAYSLPFRVSYVDGQTVVTRILSDSLATLANIKLGDVLLELDGQKTDAVRKQFEPYTGSPNENARQHAINQKLIMGKATPAVTLVLKRGIEKITTTTSRHRVDVLYAQQQRNAPSGTPWRLIKEKRNSYGYLDVKNLGIPQIPAAFTALKNTNGLIIDLRTFLFTPLVYDLISHLYDQKTEFVNLIDADASYPGTLIYSRPTALRKANASELYKGKLVILVNENTFGLSELTALALQQKPGAVILGSQTAGAYGNVSSMVLPGGVMLTFTGQGATYPTGETLQRHGVKVDIPVKPTLNSITTGRDELLDQSIFYLQNGQLSSKR